MSYTFVVWTEDWEEDKWSAVNEVLFSNKYKDLYFALPACCMYYTHKDDIVF